MMNGGRAKQLLIVAAVIGIGLLSWSVWRQYCPAPETSRPMAASPTPPPDSLSIEAMRARTYTASELTTERIVGTVGGAKAEVVSYMSDGYKQLALMTTPAGPAPAGGWPVIIFCHGYIDPSIYRVDGPEYAEFIAALNGAGFAVIKPSYRGHGQSEGPPTGGHFAPDYAYDVLNLIAAVKAKKGLNGGRIGLAGHSLGGHVALRTMVVAKDIKATALISGVVGSMEDLFFNWPHSPMTSDRPIGLVQGRREELIKEHGDPHSNPDYWNKASAINYVSAVRGPVEIDHSAADSTVPKLFSDHLAAALEKAGKHVDYHVYAGDDHQFTANRAELLRRLVTFFRSNV